MESNGKIAVCHIISGDLWAGAEAQAFTMMSALQKLQEIEISAIVLNQGQLASKLKNIGIPVAIIDERRYSFLQIVKIAAEITASRQTVILHSHRYKENILAAIIHRRGRSVRLVQTVHGVQERMSGLKSLKIAAYGKINELAARRYFDRILAVSCDIEEKLKEKYGSDKVRHVANSIDLDQVRPAKTGPEVRNSLGIAAEEIVVGAVGRMVPIKGFDVYLKSAKVILESSPNTRFLLVGDGPEAANLRSLCDKLGISPRVIFTGFREDILDVINAIDIFMMTSWHEGIPVALLEAMALGKPTVATGVGGITEVLEQGVSGLMAPAGDPAEIARQCCLLIESPERRQEIGRLARVRVEAEFSSIRQSKCLSNLYRELVR